MKRLLCFFYFGVRHDFTPWVPWHKREKSIQFRWCRFCGKEEVMK